ncbi:hypothetical protein [Oricola nitratireducens]|uniref:hypothetical protein n=1 Tax=Oricola nitratireducens TaxID=2775868 RepID=UPI0018664F43|nr:hypothetical protein [Oricola nitratireducens]
MFAWRDRSRPKQNPVDVRADLTITDTVRSYLQIASNDDLPTFPFRAASMPADDIVAQAVRRQHHHPIDNERQGAAMEPDTRTEPELRRLLRLLANLDDKDLAFLGRRIRAAENRIAADRRRGY